MVFYLLYLRACTVTFVSLIIITEGRGALEPSLIQWLQFTTNATNWLLNKLLNKINW